MSAADTPDLVRAARDTLSSGDIITGTPEQDYALQNLLAVLVAMHEETGINLHYIPEARALALVILGETAEPHWQNGDVVNVSNATRVVTLMRASGDEGGTWVCSDGACTVSHTDRQIDNDMAVGDARHVLRNGGPVPC